MAKQALYCTNAIRSEFEDWKKYASNNIATQQEIAVFWTFRKKQNQYQSTV